jgi:peptidoglycan/xylan/chitin deacetylase (PgdA/CDA1 family)
MAVLVLMYHRTPLEAEVGLDVPLSTFREQIARLLDAGVPLVPFTSANDPDLLTRGMHVAVTLDDGDRSNLAAIDYLHEKNVRGTAFIVREWAEQAAHAPGARKYIGVSELREMAAKCELGGHGVTHTGMTRLSATKLRGELVSSKRFLEEIVDGPVTSMALPGGDCSPAVLEECHRQGFNLVGNSNPDINRSPEPAVNRLVVTASDGPNYPLRMARAPRAYWALRRTRRRILDWAAAQSN